ncbi:MAG: leucine-rich repeat domain-containing protein [Holosporales bacterium]|nr:leucine-rich repeat domain-containing protein [Holosporales bacterium]
MSVEIPKSVTYIGINAFSDCQSLETVEFENSSQLTKIESDAFRGCTSLTSITIPASVRFIEAGAFDSCTNLREVRFASGSNLEYLSIDVFRNCQSLRTIEIPSKVKTICERAFSYVPIEEIYIPDSVEDIEPCAFTECRSLRQVHFVGNSNLKHLTLAAFWACSNLNELIIPASVERIDENPFVLPLLHNFGAKTIRFSHGSQLQTIGALAFATRNLQSISLPEGLQVIEDHAFEGCSLKEIFIPKTVNLIEDFSFLNCLKLEKIHFEEGISPSLLIGNNAIGKAMSSFQRYEIVPSLSRVIIPSSLKNNNYVKTFEYDLAQKDTDPISIEWVGDVLSDQQPD